MTLLVIAEHDHTSVSPATRCLMSAAQAIGGEVDLLVAGQGSALAAQQAAMLSGVRCVLHADDAAYAQHLPENMAALLVTIARNYSHVLAAATTTGKDFMPRAAALLDVQQISEIIAVESPTRFRRPIYAGNAIETVESAQPLNLITVRTTAFNKVGDLTAAAPITALASAGDTGLAHFVSMQASKSDRPELTSASVVVSGGRGLGDGEKFRALIEPLADKLGAAVGASRAAVDAGFVPNDYQVGQTGKIVAPDLYIAIGISGAIQHLAGMKGSKIIVAINKDENAPIFEMADYGLVGDLFEIVPELTAAV